MICYRDRTFCSEETCDRFGDGNEDCFRSLTLAIEHTASHWWNSNRTSVQIKNNSWEDAPIAVFAERPDCYE